MLRLSRPAIIVCNAVLVCGCVSMHGYSSVSELRADALAVFKEQNQASGAVMLLLPALDPADPMTLALAEADTAMLAACEPLNKMAIALREDQPPSLRQRRRLPGSISACRTATLETRRLLACSPDS